MRKRLLGIIMALSIISLVGCGEQTTTMGSNVESTPTPTSEPTQAPNPTIAPDDEGVVDSGVLDDVPDASEDGNGEFSLGEYEKVGFRWDYTTNIKEKGLTTEAWVEEHRFIDNPNYSFYYCYFKSGATGNEMSFTFVAPVGLGELYSLSSSEKTLALADGNDEKYRFLMWHGGKMSNESESMRNYDAESLMSGSNLPYDANTFQVIEDDNSYRVIFQVTANIEGKELIGYECWIEWNNEWYEFEYFTTASIFDPIEALAVVSSIEPINLDDLEFTAPE